MRPRPAFTHRFRRCRRGCSARRRFATIWSMRTATPASRVGRANTARRRLTWDSACWWNRPPNPFTCGAGCERIPRRSCRYCANTLHTKVQMPARDYRLLTKNLAALLLCLAAVSAAAATLPAAPADAAFMALADDYFDNYYFPANPTAATTAGIHRYDERLEDFSRAGVQRQITALHAYLHRFEAVDASSLSERVQGDRELLLSSIRSSLLTLQTIRPWQKDPNLYSDGITGAAFILMERNFAPLDERLRLVCAREKLMPAALRAARVNLRNPPRIYPQIALEQLPAIVSFFQDDLPTAFASAEDAGLKREFAAANARVITALKDYQSWLTHVVLAHSHGEFRLGAATFRVKLLYDEMVDTPLERLLEIGMADLRRNQAEFARVAKELAPDKSA